MDLPSTIMAPFRRTQKPAINEVYYIEPTDGSVALSEVIGREVEVSFLLHDLLDNSKSNCNQFKAFGIAGAAGSGKTTVCQMIFNSPQVQERFLPRIWVCMTKQPWDERDGKVTDKKLRDELVQLFTAEKILTCLGEDEEIIKEKGKKDGISGLVSRLHRRLVGKRYLIVLDGACDEDEWFNLRCDHSTDGSQSLAFGLPKGYGGAVIVNGRSVKVVEMMVGKENLHHLLPLTDKDCWEIFRKATEFDPQRDRQVEELRRFVVQEAGGHPLTAKLMGQCYERVEDTAEQAADNCNASMGIQQANGSDGSSTTQVGPEACQVTALQPVNSSNASSISQEIKPEASQVTPPQSVNSSNGSTIAQVTGPESAQVTTPLPADGSNGSSTDQVTRPEASQVTTPQPINGSDGSSIAQSTGPESAQLTAPLPANGSNGSSIDQITGPEASRVTTSQPVKSSNGSSIAQVASPELAQVTAPPLADGSNRSSLAQVTGQNQPRLPHRNWWSIVAKGFRLKNLLGQTNRSYRTTGSR